ncbi:MAG TPA: cellulase family glycosylhydrolase [Solirubrobacteraceae bacterium]|nr:cellulase family glycosylhydrolase [Solirubrobacteraceae bacterium]
MRALVVILAAMGLAALPAAGASAASGGWARMGAVQARGGPYLTDSLGRRLELHGVNVVDKCGGGAVDLAAAGTPCVGPALGSGLAYVLSPQATDPARRFTSADAQTLARLGFNVVRLGIIWEGLEPGPPGVGPNDPRYCAPHRRGTRFPRLGAADPYDAATVRAYLARTDVIVGLLARAGLRVILDMHSDVWGSAFSDALGTTPWSGEGAPLWATCTGREAFRAPPGWGTAYSSPAVQTAIHHFFANDVRGDLEAQYARVWQAVARHYRGNPAVIGYEVYNEPNDFRVRDFDAELQCDYGGPVREPRSCAAAGRPAALPEGLIGAIEAADRTHVVLFEPSGATDYGTPETIGITEPLRFPRLALAFHVYGAVPAQLRQTQAERHRTRTDQPGGPPWIMDEFGASDNPPLVRSVSGAADTMNLSWTYWSAMQFDDPTAGDAAEGLLDQATRQPIPAMARALAVPYPWATAGVPGAQSFDPATRTFRYRYRPDRALRVATDLELPPYTYPTGYTVQVTGAWVLSRRNAALLELRALPHAARVSVTVRARPGAPVRRRGTAPAAPGRRR